MHEQFRGRPLDVFLGGGMKNNKRYIIIYIATSPKIKNKKHSIHAKTITNRAAYILSYIFYHS